MAVSEFRELIHALMTEEVIPTLSIERLVLEAYRDRLLARFNNPALKHRTRASERLCSNGFKGRPRDCPARASWIAFAIAFLSF